MTGSLRRQFHRKRWMQSDTADANNPQSSLYMIKDMCPPGAKGAFTYNEYFEHVEYSLTHLPRFLRFCMKRKVRRADFHYAMQRKAAIEEAARRMSRGFGKAGIVVVGCWWKRDFAIGGRRTKDFPWDEVIDALKRLTNVVILDEKWTSKTCSQCVVGAIGATDLAAFMNRCEMRQLVKSNGRKCIRVFHCAGSAEQEHGRVALPGYCGRVWDRDVNAARNIRSIFVQMMANGYKRPTVFGTSDQSAPLDDIEPLD